ncbi:DUF5988 family protein [Streptomyces sp. MP131-18]|uniref:DUF5988 family protein n=1 Tax=Streptomyces sp. MP131-18 TaxID=1857892 RepID=UPI00097CB897|nr:DUF5988 family protein [Streptomyces sp. MP131-18]ONK10107.1 hypothetical protein STBA_08290 [Streptomyces sp. MP131-18]
MLQLEPNVLLRGGPVEVPEQKRTCYVGDVEQPVKVSLGNAYEHFLPTRETVEHEGATLTVYEWSRRTYVAE